MADRTLSRARDAIEPTQRRALAATNPFPEAIDVASSGSRKTSTIGTPTAGVQALQDPRSDDLVAWDTFIQQRGRKSDLGYLTKELDVHASRKLSPKLGEECVN